MKGNVCSFTGHRNLGGDFDVKLLEDVIVSLSKRGTDTFLCGMAKGFDLAAAEIVLKHKREYNLKLVACIPYEGQEENFNKKDKERYLNILENCEEKRVFSSEYNVHCMHSRDRYMAENCNVVVCYLRKNSGGTFYTVNYAKACGKKIIEI